MHGAGTLVIWFWSPAASRLMSTTCSSGVGVWVRSFVSFRFGHSSVVHYSFIALPPNIIQTIAALVQKHWLFFMQHTRSFPHLLPFPTPLYLYYFPPKSTLYLRRITWVSVAAPIGIYVISGVGWVVKIMEDWTSIVRFMRVWGMKCFGYRKGIGCWGWYFDW